MSNHNNNRNHKCNYYVLLFAIKLPKYFANDFFLFLSCPIYGVGDVRRDLVCVRRFSHSNRTLTFYGHALTVIFVQLIIIMAIKKWPWLRKFACILCRKTIAFRSLCFIERYMRDDRAPNFTIGQYFTPVLGTGIGIQLSIYWHGKKKKRHFSKLTISVLKNRNSICGCELNKYREFVSFSEILFEFHYSTKCVDFKWICKIIKFQLHHLAIETKLHKNGLKLRISVRLQW